MRYKSDYTIIIKFNQNDNSTSNSAELGWVDYFAQLFIESLKYQIEAHFNVVFKQETETITAEEFDNTDYIFYILSPAFVYSSNINQDASIFESAFNFDIPYINSKVKKVFKAPVNIEDLPLSLSTPTYYRFYDYSLVNESEYETYEGWKEYHENSDYWKVFADVVTDALENLRIDKSQITNNVFISTKNRTYENARNELKRELTSYQTKIFPDEDFSIEANYMEDPELNFMQKCEIAIHFPDEFINLSKDARREAFQKCENLPRFIWFNPSESLKPDKKIHYNELKIDLKPFNNIEVIETPIEEFKEIIRDKIINLRGVNQTSDEKSEKPLCYVIADDQDLSSEIHKIQEQELKYTISLNEKSLSSSKTRNEHLKSLKQASLFIVIYSKENNNWLNSMLAEIRKAPGLSDQLHKTERIILNFYREGLSEGINNSFKIINIDGRKQMTTELLKALKSN